MNRYTRAEEKVGNGGGWAIGLGLATNGVMTGTWVSRLPAISDRLKVSDGTLGLALLGAALGAVLSLFVASRLCRNFGVRTTYTCAVTTWASLYVVAVLCPGPVTLFATLFVIGLMNGIFGVVANAAAHELELRLSRPLLPRYHGMFSIGALAGSLVGARLAAHVGQITHVISISVLCTIASVVAARNIPTAGVVTARPVDHRRRSRESVPLTGRMRALRQQQAIAIVGIGMIAMCTTLAEGAANNWSAIFLHHDRGTTESMAAAGFAAYAAAMAVGRLGGTWLARRVSRPTLLRAAGGMLFSGIVLLVSTHDLDATMVAMVLWGLGVALIFPSAMGAAAEVLDEPAVGIAHVAMIGYVGFVIGPPVVGWLATTIDLGAGLLVVAGAGVVLIFLAPLARSRVAPPLNDPFAPVEAVEAVEAVDGVGAEPAGLVITAV